MKRGDPLGLINILSVAKYQKIRREESFQKLKIERGDPLESSGFVGYVKKVKNERGDPLQYVCIGLTWPE